MYKVHSVHSVRCTHLHALARRTTHTALCARATRRDGGVEVDLKVDPRGAPDGHRDTALGSPGHMNQTFLDLTCRAISKLSLPPTSTASSSSSSGDELLSGRPLIETNRSCSSMPLRRACESSSIAVTTCWLSSESPSPSGVRT